MSDPMRPLVDSYEIERHPSRALARHPQCADNVAHPGRATATRSGDATLAVMLTRIYARSWRAHSRSTG